MCAYIYVLLCDVCVKTCQCLSFYLTIQVDHNGVKMAKGEAEAKRRSNYKTSQCPIHWLSLL